MLKADAIFGWLGLMQSFWRFPMFRCVSRIAVVGCLVMFLPSIAAPTPKAPENDANPNWEFKAVSFSANEIEATRKLNELARGGWEYVGPLSHGLVAFKRYIRSAMEIERDKFQGTWILASREEGGQVSIATDNSTTFTVTGDRWVWKSGETVVQEGTFKLTDITKKPKEWEYATVTGAVGYSIYEIDATSFKYCSTGAANNRPTAFNTTDGGGLYCCIWKRPAK
jgi:uncharacterized protein (TIGR03067 family)